MMLIRDENKGATGCAADISGDMVAHAVGSSSAGGSDWDGGMEKQVAAHHQPSATSVTQHIYFLKIQMFRRPGR
jgi:hypothetical protein